MHYTVLKQEYKHLYPAEFRTGYFIESTDKLSSIRALRKKYISEKFTNYKIHRADKYLVGVACDKDGFFKENNPIFIDRKHVIELPRNREKWVYYCPINNNLYKLITSYQESRPFLAKKLKYKKQLKIVERFFNDFYGKNNVNAKISDSLNIEVTVKYGDTTIANLTKKHKIYDLYLQYSFTLIGPPNHIRLYSLSGGRTTLTLSEKNTGYIHSHLSTSIGSLSGFCLGSSSVQAFKDIAFNIDDEEAWADLFMHVDHVIQFEDVSNPYRRISQISSILKPPRTHADEHYLFAQLKNDISLKYNTDSDLGYFSINVNEVDIEKKAFLRHLVIKVDQKEYSYDDYIYHKNTLCSKYQTIRTGLSEIKFNGKTVKWRVIRDREDSISDSLEPCLSTYSKTRLSRHIQKLLFNKIYEKHKENIQEVNTESGTSEQAKVGSTTKSDDIYKFLTQ